MARPLPGSTSDYGWCFFIRQNWKALSSRARLRWMSPALGALGWGNAAEVRETKASSLACWSAMAGSALDTIARWWRVFRLKRSWPILSTIPARVRCTLPMPLEPNRGYQSLKRFDKHLVVNHFKEFSIKEPRTMLTVSRIFGVMLNIFCTTIKAYQGTTFRYIQKKLNAVTTTAKRMSLNSFYNFTLVTFRPNYL